MAAPKVRTIDKLMLLHRALDDDRLTKADTKVLAILIEATNRGVAWPSLETIANTARIQKRSVYRITEKLERLGYLTIERGGRGARDVNQYMVHLDRWTGESPLRLRPASRKGDKSGHKGDKPVQIRGTGESPESSYESTDIESFRTHGAPDDRRAPCAQKNVDPMTLLPDRPGAFLARVERRLHDGDLTLDEARQWLDELDCLADEYEGHTGDPIGGQARRLCDAITEWVYQQEDV